MPKDYCIQIHTYYRDYALLLGCLKSIRAHLEARIQVVSDGAYMTNEQVKRVNDFGDVRIIIGERLMTNSVNRGAWIVRKLRLLLESPCDLFLCMDTDSRVWRKPFYIPAASYFGHFVIGPNEHAKKYTGPIPQGGCWGLTRKFATAIYEGGYFNDNSAWMALNLPLVVNYAGILADDFYIPHLAVHHLRMYPLDWDEVMAVLNEVPQNPLVNGIPRYAFTHSCYRHGGAIHASQKTQET